MRRVVLGLLLGFLLVAVAEVHFCASEQANVSNRSTMPFEARRRTMKPLAGPQTQTSMTDLSPIPFPFTTTETVGELEARVHHLESLFVPGVEEEAGEEGE